LKIAANFDKQTTEASPARKDCAQQSGTQVVSAQDAWRLEPHVCRSCFSRIASQRTDKPGERRFECTNCGLSAVGHKASVVCSCGIKLRKHRGDGRSGEVLADAGIRCHENQKRSPEFPSLYACSFGGAQATP
jgi:hypothetical protein